MLYVSRQSMRIIAPMMILIMMTSTLAGCTGGDPDGEEIDLGISDEVLEQLQLQLDENLTKIIDSELLIIQLQEQLAENSSRINELENNSHEHGNTTSEATNNNLNPLIYFGWINVNNCEEGCVMHIAASAIDLDGTVELMGVDLDLDGMIDQNLESPLVENWGDNNAVPFDVNYSTMTLYSVVLESGQYEDLINRGGYDACVMRLNVIATDNDGASTIDTHTLTTNDNC